MYRQISTSSAQSKAREHTLESNLVSPHRCNRLLEEGCIGRGIPGDVETLKLDGHLEVLKDLLNRLGNLLSNSISRNQGAAVFGENVGDSETRRRTRASDGRPQRVGLVKTRE